MRPYNLDTSFLVDVLDGASAARETMERLDTADEPLGVTPVAAAELLVGGSLGSDSDLQAAEELLDALLWLDLTRAVSTTAGRLQARLRQDGNPIAFTDCLIAGATLVHGGRLVSRDGDFDRIDDLHVLPY